MELLFVVLGGVLLGAIVRYAVPGRQSYGAALLPAIGGIVAAIVWSGLTWAGWRFDGGWIWVVSLVASGIVPLVVALLLPRSRRTADDQLFARLNRA